MLQLSGGSDGTTKCRHSKMSSRKASHALQHGNRHTLLLSNFIDSICLSVGYQGVQLTTSDKKGQAKQLQLKLVHGVKGMSADNTLLKHASH